MWLAMVGASMSSRDGVMRAGPAVVRALKVTACVAHIMVIYAYDDIRDNIIYTLINLMLFYYVRFEMFSTNYPVLSRSQ